MPDPIGHIFSEQLRKYRFEGASFCLDDTYTLVSTEINFKDFIENNYMEVYGNVEKMIRYSGMSEHNFNRRFREEYGMPPKAWMTERFKKDILHYASLPNATTSFVASRLHITDVRLCQLTRKYYDLTPQQLIEMRAENILSSGESLRRMVFSLSRR